MDTLTDREPWEHQPGGVGVTRNVGIYIYDQVEVLDFAGPFEVFHTASRVLLREHPQQKTPFSVFTIGVEDRLVMARGELQVKPHYTISNHPRVDILIIPGGVTAVEQERAELLEWLKRHSTQTELLASVCTGVFILAEAGLVAEHPVTTHWEDVELLREAFPELEVVENERYVDNGALITSAGISAGIDMSLHLVGRLMGDELAQKTARQMDYNWSR
jgi:transcriptional regulator GlxA family with amidase domain